MSSPGPAPTHQTRHVLALVASVMAISTVVWAPTGLVGDLVMLVAGVGALMFAWEASTRPGPLRGVAIGAALLAGLVSIAAAAMFVVALARAMS